MSAFGDELKRIQHEYGVTNAHLARRLGTARPYVARIRGGHVLVSAARTREIAALLRVDPGTLLAARWEDRKRVQITVPNSLCARSVLDALEYNPAMTDDEFFDLVDSMACARIAAR
jgi:transcriptional regulator with XRE-family HTH domain